MPGADVFAEYARIQNQISELQLRLEELKEELARSVLDLGGKVETPYGLFYLMSRKKWTYSDEVDKLQEALKLRKRVEEESLLATFEESVFPVFKPRNAKAT